MNLQFKKGDKVVMHSCNESKLPKYKGKVWTCRTDSFIAKCGDEVVFLDGFRGYFMACYLVIVKTEIDTHNV